jgi:hypothetical protein
MPDPVDDLPPSIQERVREILANQVEGGAARREKNKDWSGVSGQRAISQLIQEAGIKRTDPRWIAVHDYGEALYYGRDPSSLATKPPSAPSDESDEPGPCVTPGHRKMVAWMATPAFRDIVRLHQEACGSTMSIYFRPTDQGVVRLALHPKAPAYVGFQRGDADSSYTLCPGGLVPTVKALQKLVRAFEAWLPQVTRPSMEERGVIRLLRDAVDGDLSLPWLGDGWVLLHHEWRWAGRGAGKKADILAVHVPTKQLGIVEFKSDEADLPESRVQVDQYGGFWKQQAGELAPFFSQLLQTMGAVYGNDMMRQGAVEAKPAQLFVGIAPLSGDARIAKR